MARKINKEDLQRVVNELENEVAFFNRGDLFEAIEGTEWAKNLHRPLTAQVARLRCLEWGIEIKTALGKKGRGISIKKIANKVEVSAEKVKESLESQVEKDGQVSVIRRKRSHFTFEMVGIPIGAEITFVENNLIKAKVVSNKDIEINGERTSLSSAAQKMLGCQWIPCGTFHWKYENETLDERRKRIESIGKSVEIVPEPIEPKKPEPVEVEQPIVVVKQSELSQHDMDLIFALAETEAGRVKIINTISTKRHDNWQDVPTPLDICDEMCGLVPDATHFAVLFSLEFLEILVKKRGVNPQNIVFFGDNKLETAIAGHPKMYGVTTRILDKNAIVNGGFKVLIETLKEGIKDMQFNKLAVIQNPPYQIEDGGHSRSAKPVYHTFIETIIDELFGFGF